MKFELSNLLKNLPKYPFLEIRQMVQAAKERGIDVIDFGIGDPTSAVPSFVVENLAKAAERHKNTGYPSNRGEHNFRNAACEYMKMNFGVSLNSDTEICSNIGSKEAIFHLPFAFLNAGDIVICPSPCYPAYHVGTEFAGGEVYNVPLLEKNNFLIDLEAIPKDICKRAKIIWVNYPNSPTGCLATDDFYIRLVKWADDHNIIIASDEGCYIDIYEEEKPKSILQFKKQGIITFYSLSKRSNMTGYRTGFVAGDEQLISALSLVKGNVDSGTPKFIEDVAALALLDDEHVQVMRDEYSAKRKILTEAFDAMGLERSKSNSTFYIWQKAPSGMSDVDFVKKLVETGIVATPGSFISKDCRYKKEDVNPGAGYVRFALVPPLTRVKEAAERLKKVAV